MGKVVLVTALTGLALLLLARHVEGLVAPLGAFAFLSPYLWFYARDLWDNSFAIPFSAMLLATYAAFCATGRVRSLAWSGLFATACLMTHLMTVPLVTAVVVHFLVSRRRELVGSRRFLLHVVAIAVGCLVLGLPYLPHLSSGSPASLLRSPSLRSLAFAFDGFRIFSLLGFDYVIGKWEAGGLGPVLRVVSGFSYVVGAYGLYLLNRELERGGVWTAGGPGAAAVASDGSVRSDEGGPIARDAPTSRDAPTAHRRGGLGPTAGVVALTLVFWVILANGTRLGEHPHYYSGVWIVFFLLWWTGMSALIRRPWARLVWYLQVAVMAVFLPALATWLHRSQGTKSLHYGPALENQMAVARELDRLGIEGLPPSRAHHPRMFPQAIRVLRRLHRRSGGGLAEGGPDRTDYEIVYVQPEGPVGEIRLRRVASGGSSAEPE